MAEDEAPRALRVYRDGSSRLHFQGAVESLSFALRNIAALSPNSLNILSRTMSAGKVTVMRVGGMAEGDTAIEFVTIEPVLGGFFIILSADSDHVFVIPVTNDVMGDMVQKPLGIITHHADSYHDPDYDKTVETGVGLFSFDGDLFHSADVPDGVFRLAGKIHDWHNNSFQMKGFVDTGDGKEPRKYYDIGTPIPLTAFNTLVNFSFSPYTYKDSYNHISRHLDQSKRTCFPFYRSADLPESLQHMADFADLPYGKRPFTINQNGEVTTSREVVVPGSIVMSEVLLPRVFWPFVPYLHEIPYLNVLYYSKWHDDFKMGYFESDVSATITASDMQSSSGTSPYRLNPSSLSIGEQEEFVEADPVPYADWSNINIPVQVGSTCGTWERTEEVTQEWSSSIDKSETIGTVGKLEDLHISLQTSLSGSRNSSDESVVTKFTTFPAAYYLWWSGTGEEDIWPTGTYEDNSTATKELSDIHTSSTSIVSRLKIGDVVIEEGISTLEFTSTHSNTIDHTSTIRLTVSNPEGETCHINYTTLVMNINEDQELSASGAFFPIKWVLKGIGTLSSPDNEVSITYTAPASNANCEGEAEIILYTGANEGCDTLAGKGLTADGSAIDESIPGPYKECQRITIVISNYVDETYAYERWGEVTCSVSECGDTGLYNYGYGWISVERFNCLGALVDGCTVSISMPSAAGPPPWPCISRDAMCAVVRSDITWSQCLSSYVSMDDLENQCFDLRTAFMINYGCCATC